MNFLTRLFKCKRKLYSFKPDYVVRPSETIKESMEYAGISRSDLFNANPYVELTAFNNMMNDITPINVELATKLSNKLGGAPAYWINLSNNYFAAKAQKGEDEKNEKIQRDR